MCQPIRKPDPRPLVSEFLGTALLLIGVVGSGIMAETLAGGNVALALLANAIATGCMLFIIISVFGPVSGAHFNPAVTLAFWMRGDMKNSQAMQYVAAQIIGGVIGVWLTHLMFAQAILQFSSTPRTGIALWSAEAIATFGLLLVIFGGLKSRAESVPMLVAVYITGAYWFTASTSFANPAVTIARAFSDTFAGIDPADVAAFVLVQLVTALVATSFLRWFFRD